VLQWVSVGRIDVNDRYCMVSKDGLKITGRRWTRHLSSVHAKPAYVVAAQKVLIAEVVTVCNRMAATT
jgi:hypothetical protein